MAVKTATPTLPFELLFPTAAALTDVLLQQKQHSEEQAALGHPALLENFKKVEPFLNALLDYMNRNS